MQIITTEIAVDKFKQSLSLSEHHGDEDLIALSTLKTASFLLPMKRTEFIKNLFRLLSPFVKNLTPERLADHISDHITHGNMVEEKNQQGFKQLYISPPSFIEIENKFLILGFPRNNQKILSEEFSHKIETSKHHRYINYSNQDEKELIREELVNSQLNEIKENQYKKVPMNFIKTKSNDHLDFMIKELNEVDDGSFPLTEVEKLNTQKPVNNYIQRWDKVNPKTSGQFIIR